MMTQMRLLGPRKLCAGKNLPLIGLAGTTTGTSNCLCRDTLLLSAGRNSINLRLYSRTFKHDLY